MPLRITWAISLLRESYGILTPDTGFSGQSTSLLDTRLPPTRRRWSFGDCHVNFPAVLAEVCAEQGGESFIHMSALGATTSSDSALLRSKAVGEVAVREGFPSATILRPATVFGDEDKFLNRKAIFARHLPFFPLVDGGEAKAQPVFVDDVAKAVVAAVSDSSTAGKTYSLAGPKVYTQKELAEFVFKAIGDEPMTVSTPKSVALVGAAVAGLIPAPWMTPDLVRGHPLAFMYPGSSQRGMAQCYVRSFSPLSAPVLAGSSGEH